MRQIRPHARRRHGITASSRLIYYPTRSSSFLLSRLAWEPGRKMSRRTVSSWHTHWPALVGPTQTLNGAAKILRSHLRCARTPVGRSERDRLALTFSSAGRPSEEKRPRRAFSWPVGSASAEEAKVTLEPRRRPPGAKCAPAATVLCALEGKWVNGRPICHCPMRLSVCMYVLAPQWSGALARA